MAISNDANILNLLKVFYKDGVENLMFRNSPVVKKISKMRVEGKVQNFSAMYGRGGAVSANYQVAENLANSTARNAEFSVTPGQLFSVYNVNAKEIQASKTNKGTYMRIAGNKMFAASEGFRKTMAAAFYGDGYGTISFATTTPLTANTDVVITLPYDAVMKIDIGTVLQVKASSNATAAKATLTVNAINGDKVTVNSDTTVTPIATDVLCLQAINSNGDAMLPMGLDGWLPVVGKRTGAAWETYIGTSFFGVTRSVASDRLAGQFYDGTAETVAAKQSKVYAVKQLLSKVRRAGSIADLIVFNDEDWLEISADIESTNTYFTQTSTKAAKQASIGIKDISAAFSTNFIENIIDDPFCPKGKFYILDSSAVELWSYTNPDKLNDGIADNNPGKQDADAFENQGKENDPYGLIIDDYLSIQPGKSTIDGPCSNVSLNFFGSYVVTNPSVCGVGIFYGATPVGV